MRTLWAGLVLLALAGCGGKDDPAAARTQTVSGLTAQLATEPDPPRVGHDSSFIVTLSEGGAPVSKAGVAIALFYKSLNQTGPTGTLSETSPGRYEVRDLSTGMNGRWEAAVTVSRASQPDVQFTLPFNVGK